MSRPIQICQAVVAAINEASLADVFPKPPKAEINYAINEQLEYEAGFRRVFITPSAPHNWQPSAVAPVSEQQFGVYMNLIHKLESQNRNAEMPKLLDLLEALWLTVENMDPIDAFLFSGGFGEELYDVEKLDAQNLFWSVTQLNFKAAYNA